MPAAVRAGEQIHDIVISSNQDFDQAHGVSSGRGTMMNPYVFRNLDINNLTISDTSKAVKIVNSRIGNLTLNFIGPMVEVVDNNITDLNVNQNVERIGAPTGGRFISNWFGTVDQIRHFDGRFAYNTVGYRDDSNTIRFGVPRAVNFDGFDGALFDHNLIYGSMDARRHGHHHSSMFGAPSHMHTGSHMDMVDHSVRYHEVRIFSNKIVAPDAQYALAYLDTNHADNDRTAPSETTEALNKPHFHRTKVSITGNTLSGSGLLIDVFNATDELHTKGPSAGWLTIADNRISLGRPQFPFANGVTGIDVLDAQYLNLRVVRNLISGPGPEYQQSPLREWTYSGEGILLERLDHATVSLENNSVTSRPYGIRATQMTSSVVWTIRGLRTSSVPQPVAYDTSVANKPRS